MIRPYTRPHNKSHLVRVGSSNHIVGGKTYTVKHFYVHPKYNPKTELGQGHDIALLEMVSEIEMTNCVQPIALPNNLEVAPLGTVCLVSGWGATEV